MPFFGNLLRRGLTVGEKLEHLPVDPMQLQLRTLRRLLKRAQQTAFGQYYDFKDLLKTNTPDAAFQDQVPIFDYDTMYERWWHMALRGVENVSWRGKIKYFALSSGTSGAPSKHIPVSDEMRRAMRHAGLKMFFALTNFDVNPDLYTKPMLML
ncbi:MAG: GH3 auxin-responsive promoter family protein, partial [Phaeodactylibacter sp.]|nr:GH3 auxin-responsive promoter family protein [Phaeodactylibacter sp.]